MNEINFLDTTLRDGHQSLWATRMTAAMMLPIATILDRAGFTYTDSVASGNHFVAYARYLKENPWVKLRLLTKAMPRTPMQGGVRSRGAWGFDIQPQSLINLHIKTLAAAGVRRRSFSQGFSFK
jgi:oxaloacetate decarboxylase (Na+ extruding) subunit alpha